jgi:hypothetical protein
MIEPLTLVVLRSQGRLPDGIGRLVAAAFPGKSAVIPADDVLNRWIISPDEDQAAEQTLGATLLKLNGVTLLKNGYHVVVEAAAGAPERGIQDLVYLAGTFGVRTAEVELTEAGAAPAVPERAVPLGADLTDTARRVAERIRRG